MSKFPPRGVRGAGSAFACFEHGLAGPAEYVAKANMNVVIMVQIESRRGVEEVEAICAVDGIGEGFSFLSFFSFFLSH
jgi:4-hydroxy-2-oxoheptanedioate aldolase